MTSFIEIVNNTNNKNLVVRVFPYKICQYSRYGNQDVKLKPPSLELLSSIKSSPISPTPMGLSSISCDLKIYLQSLFRLNSQLNRWNNHLNMVLNVFSELNNYLGEQWLGIKDLGYGDILGNPLWKPLLEEVLRGDRGRKQEGRPCGGGSPGATKIIFKDNYFFINRGGHSSHFCQMFFVNDYL